MKSLLADLDENANKTPWQVFTVKHGIESFEVLVPYSNADLFESLMKQPMPTKSSVLSVVRSCGGELKE